MNFKRICRSLMCLLLACCLLFNVFLQKAEATGAGLVAAPITGVATVTVTAPMVIGASLIALGIAYGTNDDFQLLVDTAVSAAGDWVKDGTVELLQTVNSAGETTYYVAGEMMEDLRGWVFDTRVVSSSHSCPSGTDLTFSELFDYCAAQPYAFISYEESTGYYWMGFSTVPFIINGRTLVTTDGSKFMSLRTFGTGSALDTSDFKLTSNIYGNLTYSFFGTGTDESYSTSYDLTLGSLPSQSTDLTDGTSARAWSEAMTNNGLKVIEGGGSDPEPPDENNGKWFWPLALTLTAGELYLLSQADEWSGKTPQEFDDYSTKTEYEIVSRPEVEFGYSIEIAPASGGETGGDSGGESGDSSGDVGSGGDDETKWFQRIITGIEELPSKFGSWFTDLKTSIEEIPTKFATWFEKIITWLETIWETLLEIPSTIASLFENLLSKLFAPAPDFIANKVEVLKSKYPYLDTFLDLGTNLKGFFMNLGSKPPIIYIDLGSATGSYLFGGKAVFVDLTWYSQYKGIMDSIIGAFIWLWLAWRVFLSIPGIIQGESGTWGQKQNDIGMGTTAPPIIFTQKELPSGKRSRGNKE